MQRDYLYKHVHIVSPGKGMASAQDIWVKAGQIAAIGQNLQPNSPDTQVVEMPHAHASIGWFDIGVYAGDPGYEHREDLATVTAAAAAGGFTAIALMPNTRPAIHSKSEVAYVATRTAQAPVKCYPLGAISVDAAGKDLAELYDMHHAGAIAFTDGERAVQDAGLLLRALQYSTAFGGLVFNRPYHKGIAEGGQMHEGIVSTSLGLKGIPALAEHLMIQRDLSLLEYAGPKARLHIHLVSTAHGVALIRKAKAAGLPVTASVALVNLCFTDAALAMDENGSPFDTNLKVMPPLRPQSDVDTLLAGLADGTIDFICTNHRPWDEEAKNLEFTYADFGMTGLETAYPMYNEFLSDKIKLEDWVRYIAINPRKVLGLPVPEIAVGQAADLTFFSPDTQWTLTAENSCSKSLNTPFLGKTLKGKTF